MMQGKSVGFFRLKSHAPSSHEIAADPAMANVSRVIDEWLLIEYAVTFLPMNQAALVKAVSKSGIPAARIEKVGIKLLQRDASKTAPVVPFMTESELYDAIDGRIAKFRL